MKKLKRFLFLAHRWLGVVMCLFVALWFVTGIIMMYVDYPELTETERLEQLPPLALSDVRVPPAVALRAAGLDAGAAELRLSSLAGRPAWLLRDTAGRAQVVFADDGERLRTPSVEQLLATVQQSGFHAGAAPRYEQAADYDQWTLSSALNAHRPLHRIALDDAQGTVLYLSGTTGEIVRDTHRAERFWNWLGSTIHWIYPAQLRRHTDLWVDLLVYLSLIGLLSVVSGGIVGLMRLRWKGKGNWKYANGSVSPYRGVDKWHHLLGLICLVFVCTFMFSGLMSMAPWGIFDEESSLQEQAGRFRGGALLTLETFPDLDGAALPAGVKEIEWLQIGGEGYLLLSLAADDRRVLLSGKTKAEAQSAALRARIERALPALLPDARLLSLDLLERHDDYYYSRHNRYRPLPVYRARFDDAASTWFHIDLNSGRVITRHTDTSRLQRWIYNGLHSLDFVFLTERGWLWDAVLILLSVLGAVFSVTSVLIGWRRLRHP